jgi:hypothetical protein
MGVFKIDEEKLKTDLKGKNVSRGFAYVREAELDVKTVKYASRRSMGAEMLTSGRDETPFRRSERRNSTF